MPLTTLRKSLPTPLKRSLIQRFPRIINKLTLRPYMEPEEIALIDSYLRPTQVMLEFGCGGSTLHFAPRVRRYYSVEDFEPWYTRVRPSAPPNATLFLAPPDLEPTPKLEDGAPPNLASFEAAADSPRSREYRTYLRVPHDRIPEKLDVVLIDGRARVECARSILPRLHDEHVVIFHDFWQRPRYHVVFEAYDEIASVPHLKARGQGLVVLRAKRR